MDFPFESLARDGKIGVVTSVLDSATMLTDARSVELRMFIHTQLAGVGRSPGLLRPGSMETVRSSSPGASIDVRSWSSFQ